MISMTKIFKKQMLNEDWGNLITVNPYIRDRLIKMYDTKDYFGKNSIVKIVKTTPQKIFHLLLNDGQYFEIDENDGLLAVNIRYNQLDLCFIINNPSYNNTYSIVKTPEFDYINDRLIYENKCNLSSSFKSESGFVKLYNTLVSWLSKLSTYNPDEFGNFPSSKTEILKKMNFQLIFSDDEKMKKQKQRFTQTHSNPYNVTVNNVTTPSNYALKNVSLKDRLVKYIENKLPQYTDGLQIPKEIKNMNENYQFKLFGCVYKFDGSNLSNIFIKKYGYVEFRKKYYYNNDSDYDEKFDYYPKFILFKIGLNNDYQLYVQDILVYSGNNSYGWNEKDLEPIDNFLEIVERKKVSK